MFDLGFVSAILAEKSFTEVIQFASKGGFSCVEMMCWPTGGSDTRRYAGVSHIDVDQLDEDQINKIHETCKSNQVYISGLGYYPNPLDPDESNATVYREHIKRLIDAASKLDVPVVNTFIGRDSSKSIEYNLDRFAEVWPEIVAYAGLKNIKIGIENCPMLFTKDEWPGGKNLAISPAIWDRMFEIIPDDHFGLNYDPSHLVWMQMDEIQPIYDYGHRFHHVHLKDVKVYKDKLDRYGILGYPLQYHSPKIPGYGDVRWGHFFSALSAVGYRGPVCIEVEDKAFETSSEDVANALFTARNFLRQFLA